MFSSENTVLVSLSRLRILDIYIYIFIYLFLVNELRIIGYDQICNSLTKYSRCFYLYIK